MPATRKGPFAPAHDRKFFLPESKIQRLGGPKAAELMRLLVEEELSPSDIQQQLDMDAAEYQTITLTHVFKRELSAQRRLREHDQKFIQKGRIRDLPPGRPAAPATADVPALSDVKLPKGVSPQEWALKRLNQVTPKAVEKLVWLMEHGRQESVQYNAAIKILGLNGIVEVEKSISVIADAEAIIRELNKRGPYRPKSVDIEAEGLDTQDAEEAEIIDADFEGSAESGGDSPPTSPSPLTDEQANPDQPPSQYV